MRPLVGARPERTGKPGRDAVRSSLRMAYAEASKSDRRSLEQPFRLLRPAGMRPLAYLVRRVDAYALALLCVAVCTSVAVAIKPYALLEDDSMIFLLGIVLVALRFDIKVSLFAAIASILAFDFFFIPPIYTFAMSDLKRTLTFIVMLLVAVVVSSLNQRLRHQEKLASRTALAREALYQLNIDLSVAATPRQLAGAAARHLEQLFGVAAVVLLRSAEGQLESAPDHLLSDEAALAERAWSTGQASASGAMKGYAYWVPVAGIHESLGVIGLRTGASLAEKTEEALLVAACARELGTALERMHLAGAMHRSQLEAETERMRSTLLSAVSHDLKTPLAGMVAAASTLVAHRGELDGATIDELLSSIVGEGERLSRLVANLLSITRLESPTIQLKLSAVPLDEIVGSVLERLGAQLDGTEVTTELPSDLPWVLAEPGLIEQVLANLVENALRYAKDSAISISAQIAGGSVDLQVSDRGPGIPELERDRVFEKFYRGSQARTGDGGAGLGLTICRAIIRAHGGKIAIRERPGGGTLVEFTLPMAHHVEAGSELPSV